MAYIDTPKNMESNPHVVKNIYKNIKFDRPCKLTHNDDEIIDNPSTNNCNHIIVNIDKANTTPVYVLPKNVDGDHIKYEIDCHHYTLNPIIIAKVKTPLNRIKNKLNVELICIVKLLGKGAHARFVKINNDWFLYHKNTLPVI